MATQQTAQDGRLAMGLLGAWWQKQGLDAGWPGLALRSVRLGLLALNLLLLVLCGLMLAQAWQLEVGDAEASAIAAARLLARGASATLDKTRIALNGVAGQLDVQLSERGIDEATLGALVDAATAQVPEVAKMAVFDRSGQEVCAIPSDTCQRSNISDRDFFTLLREHPDQTPALFGPFPGRPADELNLVMARALHTPQLGFAGVVLAVLPLTRLQDLVAAAPFGPNGAASLRMASMQLLVRASRRPTQVDITSPVTVSARLREALGRFTEAGVYSAVATSDGVDRVAAYRKLPGYPVYALVGEATEDFLGGWRTMAWWMGGFLFLTLGTSLLIERTVLNSLNAHIRAQRLCDQTVMQDISDLHQAQEQLRDTARIQALMLGTELVGMARLRGRRVVWANRGMDRLFGHVGAEWENMPERHLHADDAAFERAGEAAKTQLLAGEPYRAELQMRRKDGSLCWMAIATTSLRPAEDEVMLLVADISAQKAAELARLREVELQALNAQLVETGRVKDDFLGNLSHELRTPLNAMIGFTQLLKHHHVAADSPADAAFIDQIGESAQQLLNLVLSMLDFAKSANGTMHFAPRTLSVRGALDELAEVLAAPAREAKVALKVSVEPGLDQVVNDPQRLRQLLLNLAGNAVKFSKVGGLVSLHARGVDEGHWCIEIEDQGIGIQESDLQRLFAPFAQLSEGTTKAYGGMGLGLALAHKIASAQGGDIQVRSQPGVGSVFTVLLPRELVAKPSKGGAPPARLR